MSGDVRIATVADSSWEVVVFMLPTGGAQAVITSPDSPRKPTTITIDPPPKGKQIAVVRDPSGTVEIVYRDAK
jgi:ABC-type nitrate/sulfonate/bicarbonate transport system substrate-binding protein